MDVVVAEVVDKEDNKVIMEVVVVDKVVEEVNRWWRRSARSCSRSTMVFF